MDHLVYLDNKAKELGKLLNHEKTMIIRGATGRKIPLGGRVKAGDSLFFVETGGDCLVVAKTTAKNIIETEKMTPEESTAFIDKYSKELNLSNDQRKRWCGKRYLCLVEVGEINKIEPFKYKREKNMDDWIIADNIDKLRID